MFCVQCETQVPDNYKFCPACEAQLSPAIQPTISANTTSQPQLSSNHQEQMGKKQAGTLSYPQLIEIAKQANKDKLAMLQDQDSVRDNKVKRK